MDETTIRLVNCGVCDRELLGEETAKALARDFITQPNWITQPPVAGRIWVGKRHMPLCKECLKPAARRKWKEEHASRHIRLAKSDEESPWQQNNMRAMEEC